MPGVWLCHECVQALSEDGVTGHTPECRAGKVLARLARLCANDSAQAAAGKGRTPAAASFSGEVKHFNEPWQLAEGDDDLINGGPLTVVRDRNGLDIVDLGFSYVGEAVEELFARRIRSCVNFCAGFPTPILEEILSKYGLGYALMVYPAERFGVGVMAAIRAMLDEDVRQIAERIFAPDAATAATEFSGPGRIRRMRRAAVNLGRLTWLRRAGRPALRPPPPVPTRIWARWRHIRRLKLSGSVCRKR